jgi:hypothetical protein
VGDLLSLLVTEGLPYVPPLVVSAHSVSVSTALAIDSVGDARCVQPERDPVLWGQEREGHGVR